MKFVNEDLSKTVDANHYGDIVTMENIFFAMDELPEGVLFIAETLDELQELWRRDLFFKQSVFIHEQVYGDIAIGNWRYPVMAGKGLKNMRDSFNERANKAIDTYLKEGR